MRTIRRNNFGGISTNVRPGTILFIHIEDELKLIERKGTERREGGDNLQGLGPFDSASYDAKENIDGEVASVYVNKSGSRLPIDFQSCFRVSFAKAPLGHGVHSNVDLSFDLFYLKMCRESIHTPTHLCLCLRVRVRVRLRLRLSSLLTSTVHSRTTCRNRIFRIAECKVLT